MKNTTPRPKVVIRKYGDRRLYDSAASRYVKLEDIAGMVRDEIEVEVRDARTGKDITRVVLTQIVVEDARDRETGLPLQLLRQLVMASDRATHDFLTWYLNGTMDLYHKAQEAFESSLSEARQVVSSPLDYIRRLVGGQPQPPQPPPEQGDEVERLRRRVEELEGLLAQAAAKASKLPPKPAARKRAPRPTSPAV